MGGRGFRLVLLLAAGAAAAAAFVVPAASGGLLGGLLLPSCGAESHPFAAWGDPDAYCAFPNLGFENGTADWSVAGDTSVVGDNEPWLVSGPGAHALELGPGSAALSSPLPIGLLDPWIRFFAQSDGASGPLRATVLFRGPLGNLTGALDVGELAPGDYGSWSPSSDVLSALALPLGTSTARVLFTYGGSRGDWQVDDVYLDPCVSKVGK